jgi:hypothetical protein
LTVWFSSVEAVEYADANSGFHSSSITLNDHETRAGSTRMNHGNARRRNKNGCLSSTRLKAASTAGKPRLQAPSMHLDANMIKPQRLIPAKPHYIGRGYCSCRRCLLQLPGQDRALLKERSDEDTVARMTQYTPIHFPRNGFFACKADTQ